MDNLKDAIQKEISHQFNVEGVYDELEERWIKFPKSVLEVGQISGFVREVIKELLKLGETIKVREVEFDLMTKNCRIKFSIQIPNLIKVV